MNHRGAKTGVSFIVIAVSAASAAAEPPNPHRGFFISASVQSVWSPVYKGAAGTAGGMSRRLVRR